jgi:hypothetical protein
MPHSEKSRKPRETLASEWLHRATERARASLARDGVNVTRLRRWGFESAARDARVLSRHHRRYSLELPFGGIADQQQSGEPLAVRPARDRPAAPKRQHHRHESFSRRTCTSSTCWSRRARRSTTCVASSNEDSSDDTLRRSLSQEVMGQPTAASGGRST